MDKRITYYLVVDVETANDTTDALVYDVGLAVVDKRNNVYEQASFLVRDIFIDERDLMQSAYYSTKIPQYWDGVRANQFAIRSFYEIRKAVCDLMEKYGINKVCAYNAYFDRNALNVTERWLTKSKYRYFFPKGTEFYCIWHMACQTICKQKGFVRFCLDNGFVSPSGNIKTSAETVYAYLTGNVDYNENHTGLQDVLIESAIMSHCFRQHKAMDKGINRLCWRIPQTAQVRAMARA